MIICLRHPDVPASLSGWTSVDRHQVPRFWATIWADVLKAGIENGTRGRHLAGVDRLYRAGAESRGVDDLDALISEADFEALHSVLVSFLTRLRNEAAVLHVDRSQVWRSALSFVMDVLEHIQAVAGTATGDHYAKIARLQAMFSQISPTSDKAAPPIRALPAEVVEELYELTNPTSPRNPFRTEALKLRALLLFLYYLHLGLRRGEALLLPLDAIKDDLDPATGERRRWINICGLPEEDLDLDPRYARPSLKTEQSQRQLPVSKLIVDLTDTYVGNYRGVVPHPFLFSSQKKRPLAAQTVGDIFGTITDSLSPRAKKVLSDRGKRSVTPHDLRHTCAVIRLTRYVSAGVDLDTAIEKLRVFFGWSPTSEMPRYYARAYFETKLDEVWNEDFDAFVDALRSLE